MFADDTNLFHTFPENHTHINLNNIDHQLDRIFHWCRANKLTVNQIKTNYIIFRSSRKSISLEGSLHINNAVIDEVEATSFVGVIIDRHLTWVNHVQMVNSIIRKKVGILFRIRQFIPKYILTLIYKTFIQPHITYGVEVWGSTYPSHLNSILLSQKMAARAITFSDFTAHSTALFNQLNILDIFQLHKLQICSFMYDLVNNNLPHCLTNYCSLPPHSYSTRHREQRNLFIPTIHTTYGKFAISYTGTVLWNSLPLDIKSKTSRNTFRNSLKKYLLRN